MTKVFLLTVDKSYVSGDQLYKRVEMQKMIQDHKNMVQEQNKFNEEFCSIYRMRDTSHLIEIVEIDVK